MIADLRPYQQYKESGLPWLGQVPGHWGLVPNRGLVRRRKVLVGKSHSEYRLLSLTKQGVIVRDISTGKGKFSSDMGTSQEVHNGDLVFCLFDVPETPRTLGLSRHEGMITGAYTVFESLGRGSSEYFELFYRAMDDRKLLSPLYSGLRNTIPVGRFLGTKTPQPPSEEQMAIVRFLDWVNGRLERATRAKRKVIALLNEQKQAIIHRAVTRGLEPSVPLKPSGIPWLGDIPQHWEEKRLKAIAQIRYGLGQPPRETETGPPLIRATNVDQGRILEKNLVRVDPADVPKTRNAFLKAGEIIVVRSGALTADSAIIPKEYEGAVAGYDMVVTVRSARPEFIAMALLSSYLRADQLVIASMRAAQPHLNAEELGTAIFLLPPDEEQKQIVEFVRNESLPIDAAITRLEREIELLREYRIRLVAEVVTGKLDVREAAARLPDEASPATVELFSEASDETEPGEEAVAV